MIVHFATLVFATAGCASVTSIAVSVRNALPKVRFLAGQRRVLAADPLALDRVYLVSLIETPRHDGNLAPVPVMAPSVAAFEAFGVPRVAGKRVAKGQAHRGPRADARRFTAARFHAAA